MRSRCCAPSRTPGGHGAGGSCGQGLARDMPGVPTSARPDAKSTHLGKRLHEDARGSEAKNRPGASDSGGASSQGQSWHFHGGPAHQEAHYSATSSVSENRRFPSFASLLLCSTATRRHSWVMMPLGHLREKKSILTKNNQLAIVSIISLYKGLEPVLRYVYKKTGS